MKIDNNLEDYNSLISKKTCPRCKGKKTEKYISIKKGRLNQSKETYYQYYNEYFVDGNYSNDKLLSSIINDY